MSLAILNSAAAAALIAPWREHHRIVRGERLELVGRGDEGQAGDRGDPLGDLLGEADRRVEAGADGGAALRQFASGRAASVSMRLIDERDLRGIAGEFLAERQRRGVLRVGAADLDDVGECLRLGVRARRAGASAPAAGRGRSARRRRCAWPSDRCRSTTGSY